MRLTPKANLSDFTSLSQEISLTHSVRFRGGWFTQPHGEMLLSQSDVLKNMQKTIATKFCGKQAQGSSVRAFQEQFLIKITDLYLDFRVCHPFLPFSS